MTNAPLERYSAAAIIEFLDGLDDVSVEGEPSKDDLIMVIDKLDLRKMAEEWLSLSAYPVELQLAQNPEKE